MHDAVKMVFINILSFSALLIGIFTYLFIYPKKNISPFLLVILFSLLQIISIFRVGVYESGDFTIHVYRNISFYTALQEGQMKPTWSKDLNATYGYETFLVEAPLGDYIPAFFHFLGFSFVTSFKLLLAISFLFSGIWMYQWIKLWMGKTPAVVGAIFYQYAPFHLVDLHFRVSPGDVLAYAFVPFVLYAVTFYVKNPNRYSFALIAFSCAGLMLSHPIALVGITFITVYILYLWLIKAISLKKTVICGGGLVYGFVLSSFYWFPLLSEGKYFLPALYPEYISFEQFSLYFFSPWRYGFLFQGPHGEISFIFGYIQLFLICFLIYLLLKKKIQKKDKYTALFFLAGFFLLIFMFLPMTKPLWEVLPFYKNLQFAYRLQFIGVLICAYIAAFVSKLFPHKLFIYIICFIAIASTILNWGHRRVIAQLNDQSLIANLPYSTYSGEGGSPAAPRWVDPHNQWQKNIPKTHLEILKGDATFIELKRTSIFHEYLINAKTPVIVKENTYYFPGWNAYVNNKKIPIAYTDSRYPNIMELKVPAGLKKITFSFTDTPVRVFANTVSIFSFVLIFFSWILGYSSLKPSRLNKRVVV